MSEPAIPRLSASVILVRDGPTGLETFMVRRHASSRVAPGAYVFPGGTVRADDTAEADGAALASSLGERSDTPITAAHAAAIYTTAIRELFEEAGVLLAHAASDRLIEFDTQDRLTQERFASARRLLQGSQLSFAEMLRETGAHPAYDRLVPFSHWVTPTLASQRFDTRFFMAEMPPRQEALHCTIETTDGVWLSPRRVLEDGYSIVYATEQHLRRLASLTTMADALIFARTKPIRRVQPELSHDAGMPRVWLQPELIDAW